MSEQEHARIGRLLADAVPPLPEPANRLGEVRARVRRARLRTTGGAGVGVAVFVAAAAAVSQLLLGSAPMEAARPTGQYRGTALVVDSSELVPRLCPPAWPTFVTTPGGAGAPSPPTCHGPAPEIVGWDWSQVEGERSMGGTTWGTYQVVGDWDGERFTLTGPAIPDRPAPTPTEQRPIESDTPCPEPSGGWRPVEPARATHEAAGDLQTWLETIPEFAGGWVDQSYVNEIDPNDYDDPEEVWNDPSRWVWNLMFTGDLSSWERRVREIYGGAVCLVAADRGRVELEDIQDRLNEEYPAVVLGSAWQTRANAIAAEVLIATPELQRELDLRYGDGAVLLEGWLELNVP